MILFQRTMNTVDPQSKIEKELSQVLLCNGSIDNDGSQYDGRDGWRIVKTGAVATAANKAVRDFVAKELTRYTGTSLVTQYTYMNKACKGGHPN